MRDYMIVTDVTTDLPLAIANSLGLVVLPMEFQLNGKSYRHYLDGREMNFHTFYEFLRNGQMSTTSQINYITFTDCFRRILNQGMDVLYIGFSSGLSGTYQTSLVAAKDVMEECGEGEIVCVDSLCASAGEGLFAYTAAQKKREGMDLHALRDWLEGNKLHLCQWFTVEDLNHLKRGGRISAVTAAFGTALDIRPILHVDDEGHLIAMEKTRGRKKSLKVLLDHMIETCTEPDGQTVFIGHGDCEEDAAHLKELILKQLPTVKEVFLTQIGPIIGTHSGPGTIALFFFGTKR